MDKSLAEKRIKKLRDEISRLRDLYHNKNAPNITDDVYDSLNRELKTLLKQYPEFENINSSENRIVGKPLSKFEKVQHKNRMLSLNDAFSYEELYDWEKRIKKLLGGNVAKINYFCEIKFDGLAVSLVYKNGILVQGATRGDGFVGEDITENLKMINSIPLSLSTSSQEVVEVRGEALLSKKTLEKLNVQNKKEGKVLFANTRNAAAGSLRQLDPQLVKDRNLDFVAYDLISSPDTFPQSLGPSLSSATPSEKYAGSAISTHSDKHKMLRELGFPVERLEAKCKNLEEVIEFIEKFEKVRPKFPFGTDGIVISVDDLKLQEVLGVVGKAPRFMVAFKYPAERATTIVKDVKINVGRTGVLTPLAIFEPTLVAGSTVSKATLHNMDQIERLDLRVGDTVVIEKAGDVIPKVVEVLKKMRTGKEKKIKMPKNCPTCGASVEKRMTTDSGLMKNSPAFLHPTGRTFRGSNSSQGHSLLSPTSSTASVAYFCTNKNCPAKNERYLEHFVSVFGIYELGPKILRRFKDEGLITDAADIFKLTKEDIAPLERFGEKSAENIVDEINNKKKISLARFIWSLGILHVGEETARDLANHFGTLEKLINSARGVLAEVDSIENIGQAVSKSIASFFTDSNNLKFIKKLQDNGVVIEKSQKQNKGKFTGLTFVLTGTLSNMSREIAKEKILSLGGKVGSTVSKNTSYVLAGSEPGSKFELAQKLGIKILGEDDFNKLLNNN